jgi:hypothetical protein
VGAIDAVEATSFFTTVADAAVRAGLTDASHRWRASAPPLAARPAASPAP